MSNKTIGQYTAAVTIDAVQDFFLMQQNSSGTYVKINRNTIMGVTGTPADLSTAQVLTNKTIGITNSITALDSTFTMQDNGDNTKQLQFQLSGLTTATTRTLTVPDRSSTIATLAGAQTFTGANAFTGSSWSGGTIDNAAITVDSISGHTTSTVVAIAGLSISSGVLQTANSVQNSNIQTGINSNKLQNPVKFSVYRNAALTVANGVAIGYDTKLYDTGSNVDIVTNKGRFTAPAAGFYHFDATISVSPDSSSHFWAATFYKNGLPITRGQQLSPGNTNVQSVTSSDTLQLANGDYVEVYLEANASSTTVITVGGPAYLTHFSGFLVSTT